MGTIVYEKLLNEPMIDEESDENEREEVKKIQILYLDKRKAIIKSTGISYQETFGNIQGKERITAERITERNIFQAAVT